MDKSKFIISAGIVWVAICIFGLGFLAGAFFLSYSCNLDLLTCYHTLRDLYGIPH